MIYSQIGAIAPLIFTQILPLTLTQHDFSYFFTSSSERAKVVGEINRERNKTKVPDTLMVLVIKSMAENCEFFLKNASGNPFKCLRTSFWVLFLFFDIELIAISAETVVQKMISVVSAHKYFCSKWHKPHFSTPQQEKITKGSFFVLQLLNSSISEFDYKKFSITPGSVFFEHMLKNCPKIRSIVVTPNVWTCTNSKFVPGDLLFPQMAARWKDLGFINLKGIHLKKASLQVIHQNLPKLRFDNYRLLGPFSFKILRM